MKYIRWIQQLKKVGIGINIIEKASQKCTDFIGDNLNKNEEELEKIQYGIHSILINISKLVLLFFTAYMLGVLKYTIVAFASFASLRSFASGVHADSSIKCIIINYIIFLGNVYLSLSFNLNKIWTMGIFIVSLILIVIYAPADTEERPIISKKLREKLKIKSIAVVVGLSIVMLAVPSSIYTNLITYSILEESILITPIIYKILGKRYKNYKNIKI